MPKSMKKLGPRLDREKGSRRTDPDHAIEGQGTIEETGIQKESLKQGASLSLVPIFTREWQGNTTVMIKHTALLRVLSKNFVWSVRGGWVTVSFAKIVPERTAWDVFAKNAIVRTCDSVT